MPLPEILPPALSLLGSDLAGRALILTAFRAGGRAQGQKMTGRGAGQGALEARPLPLHSGGRKGFRLMGEPTKTYFTPLPSPAHPPSEVAAGLGPRLTSSPPGGQRVAMEPRPGSVLGLPLMSSPRALLVLTRHPFGDSRGRPPDPPGLSGFAGESEESSPEWRTQAISTQAPCSRTCLCGSYVSTLPGTLLWKE